MNAVIIAIDERDDQCPIILIDFDERDESDCFYTSIMFNLQCLVTLTFLIKLDNPCPI